MQLPENFSVSICKMFGAEGAEFIRKLPAQIAEASQRWGLHNIQPVSNLSFNFVAFAKQRGKNVILKIGMPRNELISEIHALKFYNGNGACKLLESDEEKGFLLLERLKPGTMLSALTDDDERTQIAMDVMQNIHAAGDFAAHEANKFIKLSNWFKGLNKIRPHFGGGTGIFPKELLERVESGLPDLFKDKNILLHGDFNHFNILASERGWLIIDPKGALGPAGYEIGPLMLNPMTGSMDRISFKVRAKRRVSIIQERTGWEREKIVQWALSHALLSAWWDVEENMQSIFSLECAKIFLTLK